MTAHISFVDGKFSLIHIPLSLYSHFLQPILRVLLPHDIVVPKSAEGRDHIPDPSPVHGKQGFLNISITPVECSIVCRTEYAENVFQPAIELLSKEAREQVTISREPYLVFSISSAGMEASQRVMDLTAPLAMAGISIFFITTYYTDFILVPGKDHKTVVQTLLGRGFEFSETDEAYVAPSGISHSRDTSSDVAQPTTPPPSSVVELQERTFRLLSQRNVVPFIKDGLYLAQCSGKELDSSTYSSRPTFNDSNDAPAHSTWLHKVEPNLYLSLVAALAIQPRFLSVTLTKDDAPSLLIDKALLYLFGNFIAGDTDCDLVPIFLDLSNLPLESTGIVCGVAGRLVDQTKSLDFDDGELSYLSTARAGVVILTSEISEAALEALSDLAIIPYGVGHINFARDVLKKVDNMLVDPVMPQYTKLSTLFPAPTAHPSVAPIPTVIPDLPVYQEVGHAGHVALWVGFVLMLLSTLVFISMAWRVPVEKRVFHIIATFIAAIATLSYFGMATGGGNDFVHTLGSKCHRHTNPVHDVDVFRQLFWARYVDWLLTTPMILFSLALVAGLNGADILVTVVSSITMILTGLFAALGETKAQRWGFYVFAWLSYLVFHYQLVVGGRRNAATRGSGTARLFTVMGGFILILWIIYPIIWALGAGTGKLSVDTEIIWYVVLDVMAKPVFAFWLLSTHARSSAAPAIDGFWSHGLNNEGTLRLDDDEGA
ncbi:hypothetical protein V493_00593 [Pseudogymnoascus sp. VKM F-4281 (FW-2241)]|nr:hypothetical protein V493_00593 [Pseudogymnoascus sp. VKM F-4281 (FW-2241)]